MKILALQLKRIGDLVLTTPALAAIRRAHPQAHVTLAVVDGCGALLPAIATVDEGLTFRRGELSLDAWRRIASGFDVCFDFTGNDRSAIAAVLSRSRERIAFEWVKKSRLRALAFDRFVASAVRDHHTADHYLDLVSDSATQRRDDADVLPQLQLPDSARRAAKAQLGRATIVIHPGTARADKYWLPERWAAVIEHLRSRGFECVLTGGADPFEAAHLSQIQAALREPVPSLAGKLDLFGFAAVLAEARAVVSCDTGAVHLAAAFQRPQVALYGPINPFHWRPRHAEAVVISAANPDAPLTEFAPRMKGAPMERISTELVIRATDALLNRIPDR